ncbi:MAG: bifunctional aspartate kinase/diaminopimelate decarboxylase [Oligoflexia bacterium]|nr:bifunctional aspartate kinase/diaminopimelate decarboxylase [Oligoflexia bacterium]
MSQLYQLSQLIVIKFGGTSVSTLKRWQNIYDIVKKHLSNGFCPIIVCSAMQGVSNSLENCLRRAPNENLHDEVAKLKEQHDHLARELGVFPNSAVDEYFRELQQILTGIFLLKEVTPRIHAKVMAYGELCSTQLGALFLQNEGINLKWLDARKYLKSTVTTSTTSYLKAQVDYKFDKEMLHQFQKDQKAQAFLTQGFIASNENDETVLLGRGGSDTSAAYFAAKLKAKRLEIWTDVPGMFTANPQIISHARILKRLSYSEAQEMASSGAKVLHPRSLLPVAQYNIPLHICWTDHPEMSGTIISDREQFAKSSIEAGDAGGGGGGVKSISTKVGITLISIESSQMWQESGFLADLFNVFKKHALSIDLLSTSEMNVTVSLDAETKNLNKNILNDLTLDLQAFGEVKIISGCGVVSLVGKNIRSILHTLGPILKAFEEQEVYLLSQAANNLNLSFVVKEEETNRLLQQLHQHLFGDLVEDKILGPSWNELHATNIKSTKSLPSNTNTERAPWWTSKRHELLKLANEVGSSFVYHQATLAKTATEIQKLKSIDQVFYSIKANSNPQILETFFKKGLGFECVSVYELNHIFKTLYSIDPNKVIFTPNFASQDDYLYALKKRVRVTLDNIYPLTNWPKMWKDKEIFLRLDPGEGRGHHDHVKTAGKGSKFGITIDQLETIFSLLDKYNIKVIGLHVHSGSGIKNHTYWKEMASFLLGICDKFPAVNFIDLGGGLFVPYQPREKSIDLQAMDNAILEMKNLRPEIEFWLEPGRFLVAKSGVILAKVTQTKSKNNLTYVGVDVGMNALIRPALYGSYHHIVNLSRYNENNSIVANVVGPICETGDVIGHNRSLPNTREGDILLIDTVGAYGRSMSSNYNLRPMLKEFFI